MAANMGYIVKPFGLNSADVANLLTFVPVGGILGNGIYAFLISTYKKYKALILLSIIGSIGSTILIMSVLETGDWRIIALGVICLCFFFIPIIPAQSEYSCETVFPVGEGSANGFL